MISCLNHHSFKHNGVIINYLLQLIPHVLQIVNLWITCVGVCLFQSSFICYTLWYSHIVIKASLYSPYLFFKDILCITHGH